MSYLTQLGARYSLQNELAMYDDVSSDVLRRYEMVYPKCMLNNACCVQIMTLIRFVDPNQVCRTPHWLNQTISDDVHTKIAKYLATVLEKRHTEVKHQLPFLVDKWGKFRIRGNGDSIRSALVTRGSTRPQRNTSYVQVSQFCYMFQH
jgi:hypothetical protein